MSRFDRSSGRSEFETHHTGEYEVAAGTLRLIPFRSTISERDTEFPQHSYVGRTQAVKDSAFGVALTQKRPNVMTRTSSTGNRVAYARIN
jgi:hypothetical protein